MDMSESQPLLLDDVPGLRILLMTNWDHEKKYRETTYFCIFEIRLLRTDSSGQGHMERNGVFLRFVESIVAQ